MRSRKKVNVAQYIIMILVVFILLCGIFSIFRKLTGTTSTDKISKGESGSSQTEQAAEATTEGEKVDNSVPMTKFTVTAPEPSIREGQTMQLDIKTEPANATNTKIKWTCNKEGLVDISEDGVLTPAEGSEKNTVTIIGETTDGSKLSQTFDLRIYPKIDPSKPMVAITFDDGPYDKTTPTMLDALEDNYAKATFFCLGQNAEYYPDVVKREYDLGMEVGTHTYQHLQLTTLDGDALESEITKALEANKAATGVEPTLMRPPYGSADDTVLKAVGKHNLVCINWSLDTEDWKTKNADATYEQVMKATDGDIVLLHDIHDYNVNAVKRFVPDLIEEGYQLVTVSELYEARGEKLDPGTLHYRTDPTTEATGETEAASSEDSSDVPEEDVMDTETNDLD